MTSCGCAATSATRSCRDWTLSVSEPRRRRLASARNSASFAILSKAARRAAVRALSLSGGATRARSTDDVDEMSLKSTRVAAASSLTLEITATRAPKPVQVISARPQTGPVPKLSETPLRLTSRWSCRSHALPPIGQKVALNDVSENCAPAQGKISTIFLRRLISPLRRSIGLVD